MKCVNDVKKHIIDIHNSQFSCSEGYCEGTKIALAEPTGTLFGIGQKLDEVDMEKKIFC